MRTLVLVVTCVAGMLLLGCGESAPKLDAQDMKAFDSAAPELKQTWDKAVALDQANDFAAAGTAYFGLLRQPLSEPQLQAVQTAMAAMNQRMYDAAAKGDAAAQKAIDSLQTSRSPRGK